MFAYAAYRDLLRHLRASAQLHLFSSWKEQAGGLLRHDVDLDRDPACVPGEVAALLPGGEVLVKTRDGLLMLEDFSVTPATARGLEKGVVLGSEDFGQAMARIAQRHYARWPENRLVEAFDEFLDP